MPDERCAQFPIANEFIYYTGNSYQVLLIADILKHGDHKIYLGRGSQQQGFSRNHAYSFRHQQACYNASFAVRSGEYGNIGLPVAFQRKRIN